MTWRSFSRRATRQNWSHSTYHAALEKSCTGHRPWLAALLTRRLTKVASTAFANKVARMAWAMMVRGERYREPVALAA